MRRLENAIVYERLQHHAAFSMVKKVAWTFASNLGDKTAC